MVWTERTKSARRNNIAVRPESERRVLGTKDRNHRRMLLDAYHKLRKGIRKKQIFTHPTTISAPESMIWVLIEYYN